MGFGDKETWDGEWLNSIGFADAGREGWAATLPSGASLYIGYDYDATLTHDGNRIYLTGRAYFTKGDVRLLCAALGFKLQGGG